MVKSRVKRDLIETDSAREERARERVGRPSRKAALNSSLKARSVTVSLNDPRWSQMWYLVSFLINSPFDASFACVALQKP